MRSRRSDYDAAAGATFSSNISFRMHVDIHFRLSRSRKSRRCRFVARTCCSALNFLPNAIDFLTSCECAVERFVIYSEVRVIWCVKFAKAEGKIDVGFGVYEVRGLRNFNLGVT